jgi:hypothetical protein
MPALHWINHHRLLLLGAGFAVVVVAVALGLWFFIFRSTSTPVNLRQALKLYRQDQQSGTPVKEAGFPSPGVYRYRTSGGEQLSFGRIARTFPTSSNMIVTVSRCATEQWEPIEQHMEGIEECRLKDGAYTLSSSLTNEQIAGTDTTQTINCSATAYLLPPDPRSGERWHATCSAAGLHVDFSGAVVGRSSVEVGDVRVSAVHTRLLLTFAGSETGTNPSDYWVSPTDGLILSEREGVDLHQPAGPLGSVRYTEQMGITLDSLTPAR